MLQDGDATEADWGIGRLIGDTARGAGRVRAARNRNRHLRDVRTPTVTSLTPVALTAPDDPSRSPSPPASQSAAEGGSTRTAPAECRRSYEPGRWCSVHGATVLGNRKQERGRRAVRQLGRARHPRGVNSAASATPGPPIWQGIRDPHPGRPLARALGATVGPPDVRMDREAAIGTDLHPALDLSLGEDQAERCGASIFPHQLRGLGIPLPLTQRDEHHAAARHFRLPVRLGWREEEPADAGVEREDAESASRELAFPETGRDQMRAIVLERKVGDRKLCANGWHWGNGAKGERAVLTA